MEKWNVASYKRFERERTQPAIDLANRIPLANPHKILDIGCGPGNSTNVLKQKYPNAYILGIDSAPEMIEAAQKQHPDLEFRLVDASKDLLDLAQDFDVVFSNASISWMPDHPQLLANMLSLLREDGILAVQVPLHYDMPIHALVTDVLLLPRWKPLFPEIRLVPLLEEDEYFDLLWDLTPEFSLWKTVYCHVLASFDDVWEWFHSSGLRPYLCLLGEDEKKAFEQDIRDRSHEYYTLRKNGRLLFRVPRLFFTAERRHHY